MRAHVFILILFPLGSVLNSRINSPPPWCYHINVAPSEFALGYERGDYGMTVNEEK